MNGPKFPRYQRQRSSPGGYFGHPFPPQSAPYFGMASSETLPPGTQPLSHQVAGHTFQPGTDAVGMLKHENGTILKPCSKPILGAREIHFYKTVFNASIPSTWPLRSLVPEFRGVERLPIGSREMDFIVLGDITQGMHEPCIMDVKIGKRTWDPQATPDKIQVERQKYAACKDALGFCIPGFQVSSVSTGKVRRYGKEYGKKLTPQTIKDALKIFLNAEAGLSRPLLMQLLSGLWRVLAWARSQTSIRLYSSSLLLVYDARRLRNSLNTEGGFKVADKPNSPVGRSGSLRLHITPPEGLVNGTSAFSGQQTPTGPILEPPSPSRSLPSPERIILKNDQSNKSGQNSPNANSTTPTSPHLKYHKIQRTHSMKNNFDNDMKSMRENYVFMLDSLVADGGHKDTWAHVKMIDFAHVFPAENEGPDKNYLEGIENLVELFESFLEETNLSVKEV